MASPTRIRLNLGGEGEEPEAVSQQPEWNGAATHLLPLIASGEPFLFCRNTSLPFPDDSVDEVVSNNVPVDVVTFLGPGVQSTEIHRVLKRGGDWRHDGVVVFTKP